MDLLQVKSQLTRRTEERDSLDEQFKELSAKKGGEMEKLYDRLKEKSEDQAQGVSRGRCWGIRCTYRVLTVLCFWGWTAQDKIIETLEQLNKKLDLQVVTLERSLGEIKRTTATHEDQLRAERIRVENLEREKKELQVALDKAREVPPAAPLPPGLKKLEEEVREWKSQVNMYKGKVEEKQTESEFTSS
jgi:chromosome segregation ATPase